MAEPRFEEDEALLPRYKFADVLASALYLVVSFKDDGTPSLAMTMRGVDIVQNELPESRNRFYLLYRQTKAS
jgi:hypothetical protein